MLDNWQRIERVVRWAGLSVNSFALSIGLNRGENLYQIKRGNHGISRELARMISCRYARISQAWLLTGEGDMFSEEPPERMAVPFYDVDVEKYVVAPERFRSSGPVVLPGVADVDFGALYLGRAMGAAIPCGSIVMLQRVEKDKLVPGCDYVVVGSDAALLRRVRRDPGSNHVRLLPLDTENFDEVKVPADDIVELYAVKAVVINKN